MGFTCCVPSCKDAGPVDDDGQTVQLWKFPDHDAAFQRWERQIPPAILSTVKFTPSTRICTRHFRPKFVERTKLEKQKNGSVLVVPRGYATPKENAVPSIFGKHQRSGPPVPKPRRSRDDRDREQEQARLNEAALRAAAEKERLSIASFDKLVKVVTEQVPLWKGRQWYILPPFETVVETKIPYLFPVRYRCVGAAGVPQIAVSIRLLYGTRPCCCFGTEPVENVEVLSKTPTSWDDVVSYMAYFENLDIGDGEKEIPLRESCAAIADVLDGMRWRLGAEHLDQSNDGASSDSESSDGEDTTQGDGDGQLPSHYQPLPPSAESLEDEADLYQYVPQPDAVETKTMESDGDIPAGAIHAAPEKRQSAIDVREARRKRHRYRAPAEKTGTKSRIAGLTFVSEQVRLLGESSTAVRFSPYMYQWANWVHFISPACYDMIRRSHSLIVPSRRMIQKLTAGFKIKPGIHKQQLEVVRDKAKNLTESERHVILLINEVSLEPEITYQAGSIVGTVSKEAQAKTSKEAEVADGACVCMLSSLTCQWHEVGAIILEKNMKGLQLAEATRELVVQAETVCDLRVTCIGTDNQQKNRTMFNKLLADAGLPPTALCVPNFVDPSRSIELLNDAVHIIKTFAANWRNANYQELRYPPDMSASAPCQKTAKFRHLRNLYEEEERSSLKVTDLTSKAIRPKLIEKQNVRAALSIISAKTIAALESKGPKDKTRYEGWDETTVLQAIMLKWWLIMSICSATAGRRFCQTDREPFRSADDPRLTWLTQFALWMSNWMAQTANRKIVVNNKALSKPTFTAIIRTTLGMVDLVRSLLTSGRMSYVLTAKMHSDILENQFGQYRTRAGWKPLITAADILNSQERIQASKHIEGDPKQYGTTEFVPRKRTAPLAAAEDLIASFEQHVEELELKPFRTNATEEAAQVFIAGYVANQVTKASACKHKLILPNNMDGYPAQYAYLAAQDRGGLKYPSQLAVEVVMCGYHALFLLVSPKNGDNFFEYDGATQKSILCHMTACVLEHHGILDTFTKCDGCGVFFAEIFEKMVRVIANCLLKSYAAHLTNKDQDCKAKKQLASYLKRKERTETTTVELHKRDKLRKFHS